MRYEYDLIVVIDPTDLRDSTNRALAEGWKLQGGVSICISPSGDKLQLAQAFIREVPEEGEK